eukprot:31400-Pelagococcus_subviridis.AAC.9
MPSSTCAAPAVACAASARCRASSARSNAGASFASGHRGTAALRARATRVNAARASVAPRAVVTPPQTHDSARPDTTLRPVSAAAVDSSKALEQFRSMGGASREFPRHPDLRAARRLRRDSPRGFDAIPSTRSPRRDSSRRVGRRGCRVASPRRFRSRPAIIS